MRRVNLLALAGSVVAVAAVLAVIGAGSSPVGRPSGAGPMTSSPTPSEKPCCPKSVAAFADPNPAPTPSPSYFPARDEPPGRMGCRAEWSYFNNTMMHYEFCFPRDWGFSSSEGDRPSENVSSIEVSDLHLFSGEAFPWPKDENNKNEDNWTIAGVGNAIEIELNIINSKVDFAPGECAPARRVTVGYMGSRAVWCDDTFDSTGTVVRDGPIHAIKLVVPLKQRPDRDGNGPPWDESSKLLVQLRTSSTRYADDQGLEWRILRTINPY